MVSLGNRPLSVIGPVRANTSEQIAYIKQIGAAFDEFKATYNQRWDNTQRIFDDINARMAGGLAVNSAIVPPDPEYSKTFASYFRSGEAEGELKSANATGQRHAVQAAMSVGTNSAGGYLAPVEWDRQVSKPDAPPGKGRSDERAGILNALQRFRNGLRLGGRNSVATEYGNAKPQLTGVPQRGNLCQPCYHAATAG
jgi:hypothetical protein